MALYSPNVYESFSRKYTKQQRINGGKKRAGKAKRHAYGFFLPDNVDIVSLPDDYVHGRAGGLARAKKLREQKEKRSTRKIEPMPEENEENFFPF